LARSSQLINAGMGDPAGGSTSVDLDGAPRIDGSPSTSGRMKAATSSPTGLIDPPSMA